jgi:hypothetical protein
MASTAAAVAISRAALQIILFMLSLIRPNTRVADAGTLMLACLSPEWVGWPLGIHGAG